MAERCCPAELISSSGRCNGEALYYEPKDARNREVNLTTKTPCGSEADGHWRVNRAD